MSSRLLLFKENEKLRTGKKTGRKEEKDKDNLKTTNSKKIHQKN